MRFYLGVAIRFFAPMLAGGAIAVLIAANWPSPDDVAAGSLLGLGGTIGGGMVGVLWAFTWGERQDGMRHR
jgi:hypothetical protein